MSIHPCRITLISHLETIFYAKSETAVAEQLDDLDPDRCVEVNAHWDIDEIARVKQQSKRPSRCGACHAHTPNTLQFNFLCVY